MKHNALIPAIALVLCAFGWLAAANAPERPAGAGTAAPGAGRMPSGMPVTAAGAGPVRAGPAAGLSVPPGAGEAAPPVRSLDLGAMPLEAMAAAFGLDALPQAGGKLVMNHKTRSLVGDLVQDVPRDELIRNKSRLVQAVALRHGAPVAAAFAGLLDRFVSYTDAIAAIDEERNARGVRPGEASDDIALRHVLQDKAFGSEDAAGLFRVERETLAAMARHAAELGGAAPGPDQTARMTAEYQAILAKDEAP